jgi:hypothetical protein
MLNRDAIVTVDNARLEDKLGTGLTDIDLTSVSHFLDQL